MVNIKMDRAALEKTIDDVVNYTLDMDLTWEWPCGVAYYGVSRAYEATGKKEYIDRMVKYVEAYIEQGLPTWNVNTCAMGHMLITLYQETKEQKYMDLIESKIDYLQNKALRFGDNVLQHTVSAKNDFPEQAWADTLFMAAYFMLRVGVMKNDKALIDDALNQWYWHIQYLQNEETMLWYHGYNNVTQDHMSGFFWARANAWAAYTMSRIGHVLPEPYLYPKFMEAISSLRDHLAAIKKLQNEEGLWNTILDDPESYGEVSASAGIGAAMIMQGNPLHSSYVQKALAGLINNIAENGRVLNVSAGTAVMRDREGYREVPKKWPQGWGQGLALAMIAASLDSANLI